MNITEAKLKTIFKSAKGRKIAVIGDVMLDKYVYGTISRISPEAPVPVVDIDKTEYRLGGAANVANNIKALDAEPVLIGVIGNDYDSKHYLDVMKMLGLSASGIIKDSSRPTTSKTRVIAHSQHVLRVDSEIKDDVSDNTRRKIIDFFTKNVKNFAAVILQDYNKGVLTKEMISKIISISRKFKKPVYVDPKFHNFFEFRDVTVFKPNRKETADILAMKIDGEESVKEAGRILIDRLNCEYLVLTRGEKGMMLFDKEKNKTVILNIPTKARRVADVSGAGDTVISTIAVMLAGGANIIEAVMLANQAAGIVCEEVGIIPIYKNALIDSYKRKTF
ncbi:MAG TPA: D-glycero-beta-D-manno-heptose-7-phosphate kinase [Ignavibacteria bacterium]|nr:D-glycero-beta-D-manno-heptose-7-phosphate kinase [Ignavibacteria bacterium]HMQ97757.1 D-glycero-beta-D-manno-heptose-7-phosphate kinase [Ignavibacteria bacterium]